MDIVDAQVSGGPHTNFPVLIDSTLLYLRTTANGGKVKNANGYDIIFTSDQAGATQLAHEIEQYDAVTGDVAFWVRIESLAATTSIYMFYGNSGIATFQGDVTSNGVTGVWDNDYEGVWHLNEDVVDEASGATHFDSTSNNNDGIQQGNVEVAAKIADGQDFDGANDYIEDADGELYLNGLTAFTVSLWIQSNVTGTDRGFIIGKTPDNQDDVFTFRYDSKGNDGGGTDVIKAAITVSGQFQEYESASNVQTTAWQYLTWIWSSGNDQALYIDATLDTPTFVGPTRTGSISGTDRFRIAQGAKNPPNWNGRVDEVRLSSVIRSTPWIETEYNNQFTPSTFYLLRAEEFQLTLVKRAFLLDGTPITSPSVLPKGTIMWLEVDDENQELTFRFVISKNGSPNGWSETAVSTDPVVRLSLLNTAPADPKRTSEDSWLMSAPSRYIVCCLDLVRRT